MDNRLLLFREDIRQTKGNNDDKYDELAIFNGHKIVLLLITSDKDSQIYESSNIWEKQPCRKNRNKTTFEGNFHIRWYE